MNCFRRQSAMPVLALFVLLAGPALAAAGHLDQLLRLVPADAGLVLVVDDLRDNARTLLESPFAERVRGSRVGVAVSVSPDARKLERAEDFVRKTLGMEWSQVRDDILGDAVVFAFWPGADDRPEREEGLLLLWAPDEKVLARVVDRLNEADRQSGELQRLEPRTHGGATYLHRVEAEGSVCYYLHGPLFALASREQTLQAVIDAERRPPAGETAVSRQLRRLGADGSLASLWIDPRAFDREMSRRAAQAEGADTTVREAIVAYWKALEGAAVVCSFGKDSIEVRLGGLTKRELLPPIARQMLAEDERATDLWGRFPDPAILAVAGRFTPGRWDELLDNVLTKGAGQAVRGPTPRRAGGGLPELGPDWGLCVTAPPAGEKDWLPRFVVAVRASVAESQRTGEVSLLQAANGAVTLLVLVYNSSHTDQIELRSAKQDDVEVRYLVNEQAFPPGLRPAYALKGGYLVAASSPEGIRAFRTRSATGHGPRSGRLAASGREDLETPVLRLSFDELRRFLGDRHDELTAFLAEQSGLPKDEVAQKWILLTEYLGLFRTLELTHRIDPDSFAVTLRVRTAAPLRK